MNAQKTRALPTDTYVRAPTQTISSRSSSTSRTTGSALLTPESTLIYPSGSLSSVTTVKGSQPLDLDSSSGLHRDHKGKGKAHVHSEEMELSDPEDTEMENDGSTVHDSQTEIYLRGRPRKRRRILSQSFNNDSSQPVGPQSSSSADPLCAEWAHDEIGHQTGVDTDEWVLNCGAEYQMLELSDVAVLPWADVSSDLLSSQGLEVDAYGHYLSQRALYVSPAVAHLVNGTSPLSLSLSISIIHISHSY